MRDALSRSNKLQSDAHLSDGGSPLDPLSRLINRYKAMISTLSSISIPASAEAIARRANELAERSRATAEDAVRYAAECGLELLRLRAALPGTFTPLLRSGALVAFSASTAANYMSLAERMLPADYIQRAIESPDAQPELPAASLQTLTGDAGKSLTRLYRDYGIYGRGKQGGRRAGAGRKQAHLSDDELYEARMGAIRSAIASLIEAAYGFSAQFLDSMRDEDRASLRAFFSDILSRIDNR